MVVEDNEKKNKFWKLLSCMLKYKINHIGYDEIVCGEILNFYQMISMYQTWIPYIYPLKHWGCRYISCICCHTSLISPHLGSITRWPLWAWPRNFKDMSASTCSYQATSFVCHGLDYENDRNCYQTTYSPYWYMLKETATKIIFAIFPSRITIRHSNLEMTYT